MATYHAHAFDILPIDIRTVSSAYAQLLRSFCTWGRNCLDQIISTDLGDFIINPQALSVDSLQSKVSSLMDQIRSNGPWLLTTSLLVIRVSTMGNQLMSGLGTDSFVYMPPYRQNMASVGLNVYKTPNNSTCRCSPINKCLVPAAIYSNPTTQTFGIYDLNITNVRIKGMQTGCYPLEGLLASTLECYYDLSCFQLLASNSTVFVPLNTTQTTRFPLNTTVEELINELMLEDWSPIINSKSYYTKCAPSVCTYSLAHRNTLLSIITTIISVIGGLNNVLRLIIPLLVAWTLKLKLKFFRATSDQLVTKPGKVRCFVLN